LIAAAAAVPRIARAQAPTIRIGTVPTESYAPPYFAQAAGFFSRAGLNVEITPFTTGGAVTNAAAGNALDVGMGDAIQLGLAVVRGIPFGFIAGGTQYTTDAPTSRLCVAKTSTLRSAKDLEGQTVGINGLRSIQEFANREWMLQNGADPEKVHFVEIPASAMVAALQRGTVAAAIVTEPVLSSSADDIRFFAKSYDAIAKAFYLNSWFANRDWIAKNPETARKLQQVIFDAHRWANTHHDETAPTLAQITKLPPERIRAMTRAVYGTTVETGYMQPVLDVAYKYKVFERRITATELIARI
jgi:NitT/TauT family transport system substrate-binding protein